MCGGSGNLKPGDFGGGASENTAASDGTAPRVNVREVDGNKEVKYNLTRLRSSKMELTRFFFYSVLHGWPFMVQFTRLASD